MLQPHTMDRDTAATMRGYLSIADQLRRDARYLQRTAGRYDSLPGLQEDWQRKAAHLLDMANACEMAATGCKASAAEVAALRAGGAF